MILVYPIAVIALVVGCQWTWVHTRRVPLFWRFVLIGLQVLMVATGVAGAYFHEGHSAHVSFGIFWLAMLATGIVGVAFRDRIDLDSV